MSEHWALRVARTSASALGNLRLVPGVRVCEQDGVLWLRGENADEEFTRRLLVVPESQLFTVVIGDEIVPHGARVPVGRLPDDTWQALSRWLGVALEPAALPGRMEAPARLQMVPSTSEREANVLLTGIERLADYAVNAPLVRLQRWRFAVNTQGQTIVFGTPLPPISGQVYCETEGVAVQAGWSWTPRIDADVMRKVLGLSAGDVALLHADGSWECIRASDFTAATRSAIRRSGGRTNEP
jgi:hypothetical protein